MELYLFACQHRIPSNWRPPSVPDHVNGQDIKLIQLPCSARLSTIFMLRPFEKGADGVLVMTCAEEHCHSLDGARRAKARARAANKMLEEAGVGIGRVQIDQRDGKDEHTFVKALEEFTARVKQLEPTRMQDKSPNEGCLAESERTCRRNIT